nr:hypothetical protein [Tanacetum cinerariifolium]
MLRGGFCFPCNLEAENSYNCYQDAYSFNDPSYNSNHFPQPQYENYLCNLCGNNSHDSYDCQQQFSFVYEQGPSYNKNYNDNYYPHESPSFPFCNNCGGSHETFQCQPIDQNIDFSGSDQIQTPQYPEVHPPDRPIFLNDDEDHSNQNKECFENSSDEIATSNPNEEKEEPLQDSNICHLIREECCVEVSEEQKQSMEDTMLELVKICRQKELLCIHDNVEDLIEITTILSTKEPEYSTSMGYEHSNTTPEMESDEIIKSGVEELVPILSENKVTLEDKRECDVPISENSPICDDHSEIFSDSKNDDDISVYDDFKDIEYVEALLSNPEIVSVEEENIVHQAENDVQQEEEDVDLEDISQIQDDGLRKKLLSITRLIFNIESLNENPIPDRVLNSFESDNSLLDNFSPEFKTFCDHMEETRSGNTTTHADNSLLEYDSFCFEIEPDQERLINIVKSNVFDDSSNDPLLEEADLFLAFDNSIPLGIENFANDSEGDIRFLEELLIDDFILSHESSDSNFEDNPSVPLPPPEPPDAEFDAGKEIPVTINDKDEDVDYSSFIFVIYPKMFLSLLSAESEDIIFDPGFTP